MKEVSRKNISKCSNKKGFFEKQFKEALKNLAAENNSPGIQMDRSDDNSVNGDKSG